MSDFSGMEDLLQDFLQEASDLLSDVDNKLVDLERCPDDRHLLNDIFRGFHTIKGGAGFLNATELVSLCHLTENLFDKLYYVGQQEYASIADFRAALLPFADDGMLSVYRIDGLPPEQGWLKPAAKKDEEKI